MSWAEMRRRCLDPNHKKYHRYGGRGISIVVRWDRFENFLADMGERPQGTTLDRYPNNDGNYEPCNCRWATPKEQGRNASFNRAVEYKGKKFGTMIELAEYMGMSSSLLKARIHRGYSVAEAVLPKLPRGRNAKQRLRK